MANRFWVGGTGNWDASTTTHWSATSGGAGGASVPTSSDSVFFDSLSSATAYTVTVTATANCLDMTWALPGTSGVPTMTHVNSPRLNVNGSLSLVAGMAFAVQQLFFAATSTGKTITTNSVTVNVALVDFAGVGGGWTLQDNFTVNSTQTIEVDAGTLNTNAKTVTCGFFVSTSGTRTLTFTGSTFNITGTSGTPWNVAATGTLTLNKTGSTINFTGGAANVPLSLTFQAIAWGAVNITGPGIWVKDNTATTFDSFSYTSTTNKTDAFTPGIGFTIAAGGSLTLAGNSTVNRAFVKSGTLGTQRTVTIPSGATVSLTNVDFQDIASAGTFGTWTGTSLGDALGNSGITFTTPATQTLISGATWSTASWTSRVPLPQDDVVINASSPSVNVDMPRLGRNVDFTGYTHAAGFGFTPNTIFGNWTFGSGGAYSGTNALTFAGRGAQTITSSGKAFTQGVILSAFGGSYTQQDSLSCQSWKISDGTWSANNFNLTGATIGTTGSGANIINAGNGVWTASQGSGVPVIFTSTTTFNAQGSTIALTGANSTNATFSGGGKTYNNLYWSNAASTGTLIVTGANTFNDFKVDGTTARTVQLPASTTQTVSSFTVVGTSGHLISLTSSSPGTKATLSKASGTVNCDYLSVTDSAATGGATWYAGGNSTDGGDNSGWVFHAAALAVTLAAASVSATATLLSSVVAGVSLAAASVSATATLFARAAASITLGAATLVATATLLARAVAAVTLGAATVSATVGAVASAALSKVLDAATTLATDAVQIAASLNSTLAAAVVSATAHVRNRIASLIPALAATRAESSVTAPRAVASQSAPFAIAAQTAPSAIVATNSQTLTTRIT